MAKKRVLSAPLQQAGLQQGRFRLEISCFLIVERAGQLSRVLRDVVCSLGLELWEIGKVLLIRNGLYIFYPGPVVRGEVNDCVSPFQPYFLRFLPCKNAGAELT